MARYKTYKSLDDKENPTSMKCAICNRRIHPSKNGTSPNGDTTQTLNPLTFKRAVMHQRCYNEALEKAKHMPSSRFEFASRYDEMMTRYF